MNTINNLDTENKEALRMMKIQQRDIYNKQQRDYYYIRKAKQVKIIDPANKKKVGRPTKVKSDENIIKRPRGRPLKEIL